MILSYLRKKVLLIPAILLFFILIMAPVSCGRGGESIAVSGDTIPVRYSSLLSIVESESYTMVEVKNPWGTSIMQRYLLVPRDSVLPEGLPSGVLLRTPLESMVLFSGVHATLIEELGSEKSVKGVCDADYMYADAVVKGLREGSVADCGSSLDVDVERVIEVKADAIFVLPYENGGYGKLERLGIPLVECADYMESSALGCAEWIRFYARLLGKGYLGDLIFETVCKEYEMLSSMVASVKRRPRLMCELKSSSAWYVPGGGSTVGVMYSDAGANYIFASNPTNGSVPLSYEVVLDKASDADVWLVKYNSPVDLTRSSLLADFKGYAHFKPFKEGEIYACNTAKKRIFESTSFHPEKLLRELVYIFHPELLPGYVPVYYEKMCD